MKVIDVDGSYLARKHQQLQVDGVNVAPLGVPPIPPSGWNAVSETNFKEAVEKMPKMMSGNKKTLFYVHIQSFPWLFVRYLILLSGRWCWAF